MSKAKPRGTKPSRATKGKRKALPYLTRPDEHVIDARAERMFRNALPDEWVLREMGRNDYGIDFQLEVFESYQPQALRTAVQLKGSTLVSPARGIVSFRLSTRALATYLDREHLPVFLVVVDANTGRPYYVLLQRYALERLRDVAWRDQRKVKIELREEDRVDDRARFVAALREAHRWNATRLPAAIPGSIAAEEQRLQSIDPRFRCRSSRAPAGS